MTSELVPLFISSTTEDYKMWMDYVDYVERECEWTIYIERECELTTAFSSELFKTVSDMLLHLY